MLFYYELMIFIKFFNLLQFIKGSCEGIKLYTYEVRIENHQFSGTVDIEQCCTLHSDNRANDVQLN